MPWGALLPGGRKFSKITKRAVKIILWPKIFGCHTPWPPVLSLLTKSGRRGARKNCLTIVSFFQWQFGQKKMFFMWIWSYCQVVLSHSLSNKTDMTMQNIFCILQIFFSQIGIHLDQGVEAGEIVLCTWGNSFELGKAQREQQNKVLSNCLSVPLKNCGVLKLFSLIFKWEFFWF